MNDPEQHQDENRHDVEPVEDVVEVRQGQGTATQTLVDLGVTGHRGNRHEIGEFPVVNDVEIK